MFIYKILTYTGNIHTGISYSKKRRHVNSELCSKAKSIIFIKPASWSQITIFKIRFLIKKISRYRSIKKKHVCFMFLELKTFLVSGVSLVNALDRISELSIPTNLKDVVIQLSLSLKKGLSFSDALTKHPNVFANHIICSVKGGEISNHLNLVLDDIITVLEWEEKTTFKLLAFLGLPLIMIVLISLLSYVLFFVILVRSVSFLTRNGQTLPTITLLLIEIRVTIILLLPFITKLGALFLIVIAGLLCNKKGRPLVDFAIIKLPFIGHFYLNYMSMKATRTIAVLYKYGVPIVTAIQISKGLFVGGKYEERMDRLLALLHAGNSLGHSLAHIKFFPSIFSQLLILGEETGKTGENLDRLGDYFYTIIERKTTLMMSMIELTYLCILVGYVLLVFFGFYLPMMTMASP